MLVLALGSIPLLVLEGAFSFVEMVAGPLYWAISGVFVADLVVRLVLHGPGRVRFAASRRYDFVIVALTLIPVLMPLRALRSVRLLKLLRAFRVTALGLRSWQTAKQMWGDLSGRYVIVAAKVLVVAFLATVWQFEGGGSGGIDSYGGTTWWTILTMTIVGYGDVFPITAGEKIAAVLLMVVGVTVLELLSPTLLPCSRRLGMSRRLGVRLSSSPRRLATSPLWLTASTLDLRTPLVGKAALLRALSQVGRRHSTGSSLVAIFDCAPVEEQAPAPGLLVRIV